MRKEARVTSLDFLTSWKPALGDYHTRIRRRLCLTTPQKYDLWSLSSVILYWNQAPLEKHRPHSQIFDFDNTEFVLQSEVSPKPPQMPVCLVQAFSLVSFKSSHLKIMLWEPPTAIYLSIRFFTHILNKFWGNSEIQINSEILRKLRNPEATGGPERMFSVYTLVGVCRTRHPQKLNTWGWISYSFIFIHRDANKVPKTLRHAIFPQQKAAAAGASCSTTAARLSWESWSSSSCGRRRGRWSWKVWDTTSKPERASDEQLFWEKCSTYSGA